jgi:hypothetical protein
MNDHEHPESAEQPPEQPPVWFSESELENLTRDEADRLGFSKVKRGRRRR